MTNADVIRQMTDEELYKFLQAIEVGDIDYSLTFCSLCKKDNQLDCDECFKRWLFNDAHDYNGLLKDKGINSGYADRKTENSSEIPNNCANCKHLKKHNGNLADWVCDRKGSIVTNPYDKECDEMWECKDEPQTDTEIAKAIVHKMIDDAVIASDAYPDLRQKMHDAVDEYEPQTDCLTCRYNSDEWDSPKCDGCSKAHSNYEPQMGRSDR